MSFKDWQQLLTEYPLVSSCTEQSLWLRCLPRFPEWWDSPKNSLEKWDTGIKKPASKAESATKKPKVAVLEVE